MDRNKLVGGLEEFLDQQVNFKRIGSTEPPVVSLYAVDPGPITGKPEEM